MKKSFLAILTVVVLVSVGFSAGGAQPNQVQAKVIAYYFHASFRCYSCTMIESYSKEAINNKFKDELASGRLEFKSVNVEERNNRHFIEDYQLYSQSLVLSLVKDGKEIKSRNLNKIWEYARNKQKFFDYVAEEVGILLKEA